MLILTYSFPTFHALAAGSFWCIEASRSSGRGSRPNAGPEPDPLRLSSVEILRASRLDFFFCGLELPQRASRCLCCQLTSSTRRTRARSFNFTRNQTHLRNSRRNLVTDISRIRRSHHPNRHHGPLQTPKASAPPLPSTSSRHSNLRSPRETFDSSQARQTSRGPEAHLQQSRTTTDIPRRSRADLELPEYTARAPRTERRRKSTRDEAEAEAARPQ